jgi:hypothetical protein
MKVRFLVLTWVVGAMCLAPGNAFATSTSVPRAMQVAPTTSLPKSVTSYTNGEFGRKEGLDATQTRRVAAPGGGFWDIIPGKDDVCLFIESEGASGCAPAADAAAGKLVVALLPPPVADGKGGWMQPSTARATYLGVAAAGATRVTAARETGTPDSADVTGNGLYRLMTDNSATTVTVSRDGAAPVKVYDSRPSTTARAAKSKKPLIAMAATLNGSYIPYGTFCCRWFDSAGTFGLWRYINEVYAYWGDGVNICVNAQNHDGTWAGTAVCSNYKADHVYNSIYNRRGIVCAQGGGNYTYGFGMEFYDE